MPGKLQRCVSRQERHAIRQSFVSHDRIHCLSLLDPLSVLLSHRCGGASSQLWKSRTTVVKMECHGCKPFPLISLLQKSDGAFARRKPALCIRKLVARHGRIPSCPGKGNIAKRACPKLSDGSEGNAVNLFNLFPLFPIAFTHGKCIFVHQSST